MLQHFIDGNRSSVRGDYESAATSYLQCLRDENDIDVDGQVNCFYNLGLMQQKLGEHSRSISTFTKCIRAFPNETACYEGAGTSSLLSGNASQARDIFSECLEVSPNSSACAQGLGVSALAANDILTAESALRTCLRTSPRNPVCLSSLAEVHAQRKEYEPAITALHECIDSDPSSSACHSQLGAIHFRKYNFPASIRYSQKAVGLAPKNAANWFQLALAQKRDNQVAASLVSLDRCIGINPNHINALELAGRTNVEQSNDVAAVRFFEMCVAQESPLQQTCFKQLGETQLRLQNFEAAAENIKKNILLNPIQVDGYSSLFTAWTSIAKQYSIAKYQQVNNQVQEFINTNF